MSARQVEVKTQVNKQHAAAAAARKAATAVATQWPPHLKLIELEISAPLRSLLLLMRNSAVEPKGKNFAHTTHNTHAHTQ